MFAIFPRRVGRASRVISQKRNSLYVFSRRGGMVEGLDEETQRSRSPIRHEEVLPRHPPEQKPARTCDPKPAITQITEAAAVLAVMAGA